MKRVLTLLVLLPLALSCKKAPAASPGMAAAPGPAGAAATAGSVVGAGWLVAQPPRINRPMNRTAVFVKVKSPRKSKATDETKR